MHDELMLLWQQGASNEPSAEEVAKLAGRASLARFDRNIFLRNLVEYLAGAILLFTNVRSLWKGPYVAAPLTMIAGVSFVMLYFWRTHRNTPLDVSADARTYHAAMLGKMDKQIRLLSSVRYWYVLPIYLPILVQTFSLPNSPRQKFVAFILVTLLCSLVIWLNERLAVRRLKTIREKIVNLYRDEKQSL